MPPPLSPSMMTRAQAEEIIRNGRSVTYNGQIISTLAQVDAAFPAPEELLDANDPVATNEALGALQDQRAALQKREERLRQRITEAAEKPKAQKAAAPKGKAPKAGAAKPTEEQERLLAENQPIVPEAAAEPATRDEPPKEPSKAKRAPRRGKAAKKKT